MFRRFFQRATRKQTPDDGGGGNQEIAPSKGDDGVHRMAIRAGEGGKPPEDPDEREYAREQGEHVELARSALQARDFKRSIYHLGLALVDDPVDEEYLALLDQWIAAAGAQVLDFVPLNDEQYFVTLQASQFLMKRNTPTHRMEVIPLVGENYHAKVAVHAYILATQGKMKEAVSLLLQLLEVKPELSYGYWLTRWVDQPGFIEALKPRPIVAIVQPLISKYTGTYVFSEQGRAEISRYLPLLRKTFMTFSDQPMNEEFFPLAFMYAAALRKVGSFEEAASIVRKVPTTSYFTLVARAMAEEALGNLDACESAYRQALVLQPDDVAVRNDLGTLFLHQGKLAEALAMYEESTRLDASDPYQKAFAHVAYLRYLQSSTDEQSLERLRTLAQSQRSASHLLYLLNAPYIGKLPYPGEALINLLRNVKAKNAAGEVKLKAGETTRIGLNMVEAPSALLAVKLVLDAQGVPFRLEVDDVLSPDPRQPLRPVEYQIWRYEGMEPTPVVPPPDPAIARRIAELARMPYALDRWHAPARELGQNLGPDALMGLLGVMVHPPTMPDGWDEWDWLTAVQLASALTIAYIDTGWEGSQRKTALTSLIYGPMDWSGAAALIAMAVLARQDSRIAIELEHICRDLWQFGPGSAEWPLERATVFGLIFADVNSEEAAAYINAYFERMRKENKENEEGGKE